MKCHHFFIFGVIILTIFLGDSVLGLGFLDKIFPSINKNYIGLAGLGMAIIGFICGERGH